MCENRCFEKLTGLVEVDILSEDGLESICQHQKSLAVAVCKIKLSNIEENAIYLMLLESQ